MIKLQLVNVKADFVAWENECATKEEALEMKKKVAHWEENKELRFVLV